MRFLLASLLLTAACSTAYATPMSRAPRTALAIAPARVRAPYDVQVLRADGEELPTYAYHGRFYVEGDAGERYLLHITNPTPHRVEAVVTVDGLDVIDGDSGDLRKRGYIVPAYGDVQIEGFRTSLDDVATFRFSSVDGSYAGRKGKARNVGVIAVAIFEEAVPPEQQIVVRRAPPPPPYYGRDDYDAPRAGGVAKADAAPRGRAAEPPAPTAAPADAAPSVGGARRAAPAPAAAPRAASGYGGYGGGGGYVESRTRAQPTYRPGLGTQFGEERYSSATYTRFVRASSRPIAIAELRYNDTAGLIALGVPVTPLPDEGEIITRETANPFPGDTHFSRAP